MATLIIRDLDEALGRMLKREAKKRQLSVNRLVHQLIAQCLQNTDSANPQLPRNDLGRFAGRWTAGQLREFNSATKPFSKIDNELWK